MASQTTSPLHIFISHDKVDNDIGHRLADDLRKAIGNDTSVWYDSRGSLRGGVIWQDEITKEINRCNVFIILLSAEGNRSSWVKREKRMALRRKKLQIIPLLCRPCTVPPDLEEYQYISFVYPKSYDAAFQELLTALGLASIS